MRPQRQPNGLVIGAETGQTKPEDDGAELLDDELVPLEALAACAAGIWSPSSALEARSASISEASARSCSLSVESATSLSCLLAARESRAPSSAPRVSRTWAARAVMTCAALATCLRTCVVRLRASA